MSSREEILSQLNEIKESLSNTYPIASMALFGSYARSEQTSESDIDLLVELNGQIGSRFIDLADELEKALGQKVDMVSRNGIKPRYFEAIESELIYV